MAARKKAAAKSRAKGATSKSTKVAAKTKAKTKTKAVAKTSSKRKGSASQGDAATRRFPGNVTAKMFGFKQYPYFEAPPSATAVPKVDFGKK